MSGLPHGVMVALQILVLPVEVRILVRQQSTREADLQSQLLLFYMHCICEGVQKKVII